jgi:hypothetical protein
VSGECVETSGVESDSEYDPRIGLVDGVIGPILYDSESKLRRSMIKAEADLGRLRYPGTHPSTASQGQ